MNLPPTSARVICLDPDYSRPEVADACAAWHTPVEEILANISYTVLKLDKFSIYDNFFQLGGHSRLATQVVLRVRNAFKLDLPLINFFEAPTIQALARKLHDLQVNQDITQAPPIAPVAPEEYRVQNGNV